MKVRMTESKGGVEEIERRQDGYTWEVRIECLWVGETACQLYPHMTDPYKASKYILRPKE